MPWRSSALPSGSYFPNLRRAAHGYACPSSTTEQPADCRKRPNPRFHCSEQLPCLALEPPELDLLDQCKIDWAGVDRDTGQKVCGSEVSEACGLFHHVLAREIIP